MQSDARFLRRTLSKLGNMTLCKIATGQDLIQESIKPCLFLKEMFHLANDYSSVLEIGEGCFDSMMHHQVGGRRCYLAR